MKVGELIELLLKCDSEAYVGFAGEDNVTDIHLVELKLEHLDANKVPHGFGSQVYLHEDEPLWEGSEDYDIEVVERNHDSTFVQTKYTDLY